ncbi:amino acid ABC transporter permease [Neobacillus sp. MM2021_6]|uniref:amino acid ABC transporter permease n=1 Tax=Bacillaceae TaxID=186817 RepID=UPI001408F350|nr:amino acid ABC transporter permease [Neobacillus sp. OS1-2]MBO0962794.1 amino acid ABC transporter permease [Neobacillus sp. MM2021_6]NHC19231.1 amino acid ABC transporter permease [Bacillus sp. MM2020_4]WML42384.1 amino acid ABC transporter permease [Neobacillus sp. OS1-2]
MIQIFFDTYEVFIFAALLTLRLTITSLLIGCLIGLIMAFFKISTNKWLNKLATGYIGLIRGTPLIVQIAILYFGIASVVTFSQFWAGALALAIHNGAYIAEIFRGSIQSIDRGQMEAARSLGMSYPLAMRRIILPQAFKFSIPPLGNQFIIGLKDSSLVAYVGMSELWGSGLSEAASNYRQLDTYIVVGLYYLILVMLFTYLLRKLEMRMDIDSKPIT